MAEPGRGRGAGKGAGAGKGPARKGAGGSASGRGAAARKPGAGPAGRRAKPAAEPQGRVSGEAPEGILPGEYDAADSVNAFPTARRIAAIAQDKLAEDVLILDMREFCSFTDAFVIASGRNPRQVKSIVDEVLEKMRQEQRLIARSVAGERDADWIVVDFVDVVVHVFTPEQRQYYRLEELWSDVPRVELDASDAA